MTPVTPSSVCDMQGERDQFFKAYLKADPSAMHVEIDHAWDGVSGSMWQARAALAERTQQEALTDEHRLDEIMRCCMKIANRYAFVGDAAFPRGREKLRELLEVLDRPTSAANSTAPMQPSEAEKAALEVAWCWGQYGWVEETRLAIGKMCAVLEGKAQPSSYSAPSVEAVENELGMGAGAWDTIKPESIIDAVLKLAALAAPTQAAGGLTKEKRVQALKDMHDDLTGGIEG